MYIVLYSCAYKKTGLRYKFRLFVYAQSITHNLLHVQTMELFAFFLGTQCSRFKAVIGCFINGPFYTFISYGGLNVTVQDSFLK